MAESWLMALVMVTRVGTAKSPTRATNLPLPPADGNGDGGGNVAMYEVSR